MPIIINDHISLADSEVDLSAIRAQGKGGQNVNKVSSAIQLRFDIQQSSLPERCKKKLLSLNDQRISDAGVIVIKAQEWRTQEKNRQAALERLRAMILDALRVDKKRIATRPTLSSKTRRLDRKNQRGNLKKSRQKIDW